MEVFEVIHPGPLTTVQDLGRYGYQQYGVPASGAMDDYALRVSNLLAGNDEGAAGLEITLPGLQLRVLEDTVIAITGADFSPTCHGRSLPMWQAVKLRVGDILAFLRLRSGCRSYLAMAGGIDVPQIMGSRSTYIYSRVGGLEGRPLRPGDRLRRGEVKFEVVEKRLPPQYIPRYDSQSQLRVILGPQDDYFTEQGIHTFLHSGYTVSIEADRVGYRLQGAPIEHRAGADIISDGIPLGAVQVPRDGLPIVLLADRQTTGGYTKIAVVITVDIARMAQAKPGDRVRFVKTTEEEAHRYLREAEQRLHDLRQWVGRGLNSGEEGSSISSGKSDEGTEGTW